MPITTQDSAEEQDKAKNRRASLPHNMKIPTITITPSTPSPDPDHPDYPEFFEGPLYLDSMNSLEELGKKSSKETETSSSSIEITDHVIQDRSSDNDVVMLETSASERECSTPELDEVFASAKTDEEKRNVLKFQKRHACD